MTIRKGHDWGREASVPHDAVEVGTDAEARAVVTRARRAGQPPPPLHLLGGDLARALGAPEHRRTTHAREVPVDVGAVLVDGVLHWFVAHLVARRPLWSGRFVVAMNTEYLGAWKVAPRAHPNDGRLDVLDGTLTLDDRLKARRRLPRGEHLPHPGIAVRQTAAVQIELDRPTQVWLDGDPCGRAQALSIRVEPDAITCYV
jgi:diacylglycerol kinase family enzyme